MGTTGYYFQGFGEQAYSFGGFREPCKKVKKNLTLKEKPSFRLIFFLKIFRFWWQAPQTPLGKSKCHYFRAHIWVMVTDMANSFYYCGKLSLKLLIFRLIKGI